MICSRFCLTPANFLISFIAATCSVVHGSIHLPCRRKIRIPFGILPRIWYFTFSVFIVHTVFGLVPQKGCIKDAMNVNLAILVSCELSEATTPYQINSDVVTCVIVIPNCARVLSVTNVLVVILLCLTSIAKCVGTMLCQLIDARPYCHCSLRYLQMHMVCALIFATQRKVKHLER